MKTDYWFIIGCIYLLILTYQDYKSKGYIDGRYNFFMMGISVSLVSHFERSIWYLLSCSALMLVIRFFGKKYEVIGFGDIQAILWIYFGLAIISPYMLLWFVIFLLIAMVIFSVLKNYVFKYRHNVPMMSVILIVFILNGIIFRLFV